MKLSPATRSAMTGMISPPTENFQNRNTTKQAMAG